MKILLLGSGGREHAFAKKITESPLCTQLFIMPGNAGTALLGKNIPFSGMNFDEIKDFCQKEQVELVVVGSEAPLVAGIYDYFQQEKELAHIPVIGPSQIGASLEGSKEFAKQFMERHQIPTARYQSFTKETLEEGYAFLETLQPPFVLKADGLAAGKGVLILEDIHQAKKELEQMLVNEKFGASSRKVIIEEFLSGIELSCFVLTDGDSYKILPTAKDYKRIGEGDTGLNTGGMGAVSPVPFATTDFMAKVEERIVKPTINGLKKEKIIYKGFIFLGLIKVGEEPFVIEYNVRMGDPETQAVFPRIETDMVALFQAVAEGKLKEIDLKIVPESAVTVVVVSGGYPEDFEKNKKITGVNSVQSSTIFYAGVSEDKGEIFSQGGRVLAVTSLGKDFKQALKTSYENIEKIHFDKMYYRRDIGFDL